MTHETEKMSLVRWVVAISTLPFVIHWQDLLSVIHEVWITCNVFPCSQGVVWPGLTPVHCDVASASCMRRCNVTVGDGAIETIEMKFIAHCAECFTLTHMQTNIRRRANTDELFLTGEVWFYNNSFVSARGHWLIKYFCIPNNCAIFIYIDCLHHYMY